MDFCPQTSDMFVNMNLSIMILIIIGPAHGAALQKIIHGRERGNCLHALIMIHESCIIIYK